MKSFSRLILLSTIAISTSAAAQLSSTFTFQRNFAVAASGATYSRISASCPAGHVALSGGVDTLASAEIEITTLAPMFGASFLYELADGVRSPPDGWYATVINHAAAARTVILAVVCAPITGVSTAIASSGVTNGNSFAPGEGGAAVACPNGTVVTGGGLDASGPSAMKVTSNSPYWNTGKVYLSERTPGTNPAANGWIGIVTNQGTNPGAVKVAAICAPLTGVITLVTNPGNIAAGTHGGNPLVCPAGYIAVGGGLDSDDVIKVIATASAPVYNGYAYAAERGSGNYPAPAGWFADAFNHATGARKLTVGVICATVAVAPAGSLVVVYEFYNTNLKHYFRTSSAAEATGIDGGSAGAGWVRTGDNFTAFVAGGSGVGSDVCRFYTFGANSHFYTAFADECNGLKFPSSGWVYEGLSYRIQLPAGAVCPQGTNPVHRLYNNRFAFTDSNHRFTTVVAEVAGLQALGWQYEGVAFCALNYSGG